jgi:hypothetical protein
MTCKSGAQKQTPTPERRPVVGGASASSKPGAKSISAGCMHLWTVHRDRDCTYIFVFGLAALRAGFAVTIDATPISLHPSIGRRRPGKEILNLNCATTLSAWHTAAVAPWWLVAARSTLPHRYLLSACNDIASSGRHLKTAISPQPH